MGDGKRTPHGEERARKVSRPTEEAFRDKANPKEIYEDIKTGNFIFVGKNGRTHVFTSDGKHHTSFRTTSSNRRSRENSGRWRRIILEGEEI